MRSTRPFSAADITIPLPDGPSVRCRKPQNNLKITRNSKNKPQAVKDPLTNILLDQPFHLGGTDAARNTRHINMNTKPTAEEFRLTVRLIRQTKLPLRRFGNSDHIRPNERNAWILNYGKETQP